MSNAPTTRKAQTEEQACKTVVFTVLICTYKRSELLRQAIDSVLATTPRRIQYEILVVDNAEDDKTRFLVTNYASEYPVRYVLEKKIGLSNARNTGVGCSKGKFVVFLDDDGEVAPGWLEGFESAFKAHPDASAIGGRIVPKFHAKEPFWLHDDSKRFYGEYDLGTKIERCDWVPGGNAAWRLSVVTEAGGFDANFGRIGSSPALGSEESVLIKAVEQAGGVFYYTPEALMYHHIIPEKLKIRWIVSRYFGQGVTSVRWQVALGNLSEKQYAKRHFMALKKRIAMMALVVFKSAALFRRKKMTNALFEIIRSCGELSETYKLLNGNPRIGK